MKIIATIFFLSIMLVFSSPSRAEDKVFTNEDQQKYQDKGKPLTAVKPGETITYEELRRGSGKTLPMPKSEEKPKPILSETEEVGVSISGCQMLQEALDGKAGNTKAVITVLRYWRTIEEICDTVRTLRCE